MSKNVETDIAIVGGGVTGLWLLNRLRQLNMNVILLESNTLGGGQTHKAQGIIHGGMKYALQGVMTKATNAIADMPAVWNKCLEGRGVIDLKNVPVLSPYQYLWSPHSLTAKLTGFFASITLKGKVRALNKADFPAVFQHAQFHGQVYALEEMVIHVNALIRELAKPHHDVIFKIDPMQAEDLQFDASGNLHCLQVQASPLEPVCIKAQKYIFTAGSGNELLKQQSVMTQRRPLHMVVVKTDFNYPLYAHCLGVGSTPRVTITTHTAHDGKTIWYLGGQLAEEGVKYEPHTQVQIAKKELHDLFPWLDFSTAQFASFYVDRAEPAQPEGKRPDGATFQELKNIIVAWPTKLAFAPQLTEDIIEFLQTSGIKTQSNDISALRAWPMPTFAKPIWDQLLC